MQHWVLEYYQVYSINDPGLTMTYFMAMSNLCVCVCVGCGWGCMHTVLGLYACLNHETNCIKSDFKEISLKRATNGLSDKAFLLTSKSPARAMSVPAPGLYTCIKSWKKLYKIRLPRHDFETCIRWMKWQEISVDIKTLPPGSCLLLPRGYIHV